MDFRNIINTFSLFLCARAHVNRFGKQFSSSSSEFKFLESKFVLDIRITHMVYRGREWRG